MGASILVVEDEAAIAELIAVNLRLAGFEALTAQDVGQAQTLIRAELPDLIVLDWMLPGASGLALTRTLRSEERTRHVPIILLTAKGAEGDKVTGLEAGADDYVTKPFSPKELIARIKAVLRRRAPQHTDDMVRIGGLCLDPVTHRVTGDDGTRDDARRDGDVQGDKRARCDGVPLNLTPAEFRLLHFFMTHPERVFSRVQLLDQVWGDHVFIEDRTVDVHVRRLRNALKPGGHERHLETVRGAGYRFTARPAA